MSSTKRVLIGSIIAVLIVITIAITFFLGGNHTLNTLNITTVTPDQIAKAMSDDNFYGLYRERTLVVNGTVASISEQNGETLIEFKTDAIFKAYCNIGNASTTAQQGGSLTVLAEGFTAERLTTGIQLQGCVVLK